MRTVSSLTHEVERIDIRFCRSHNDIRISPVAVDDTACFLQTHRDFTLGIGALSYCVD